MGGNRVYGIDLGTTYSCIAHVDEHGKPVVVSNAEGDSTTPSVVYFETESSVVVGQAAKEVTSIYPDSCVPTIKRAMGDPEWEQTFFGKPHRPQEISSFILRKLVADASAVTGDEIKDVVITCPAYFGINEKEATKQAGELAGLNVLYVIPEPTAAALAYGIGQDEDQVILVYDLGGGTFDVTLIEIKGRELSVICTGGDHQLGGKDWDDAVVCYLAEQLSQETGASVDDILSDKETYQELLGIAESVKKSLSSRQAVTQAVRFDGERARVELTRETFDAITNHHLERTLSLTAQEIERAREKGFNKIDKLLLVGGSTYMPQVIDAVKERLGLETQQFDPNQAVAKGAALFGYKCFLDQEIKIRVAEQTGQRAEEIDLDTVDQEVGDRAKQQVAQDHGLTLAGVREVTEKKITNVSSKSFGIVAIDSAEDREVVLNLVLIDDKVPVEVTEPFGTYADNQVQVDLRCIESKLRDRKRIEVDEGTEIGSAVLPFTRALPKGSPLEVTFRLGPDGLLHLFGRDLTTGQEVDARFETDSIMSREELETCRSENLQRQVS